MKEFIAYLLTQIVSKPEEVQVFEEVEPQSNFYVYKVSVAQEDMGIVIGKEGRNIKSLRALTRAKAIKDGVRMNIELDEKLKQEEQTQPQPEA